MNLKKLFMSMYIRHPQIIHITISICLEVLRAHRIEYTDTVDVELANSLGIWNGSGMSNLKTIEFSIGKEHASTMTNGIVKNHSRNAYTIFMVFRT